MKRNDTTYFGLYCSPETKTCDCDPVEANWDPELKTCSVLPGGFCYRFDQAKSECVKGAKCIDAECTCEKPGTCPTKKAIPDPGPAGNPRP